MGAAVSSYYLLSYLEEDIYGRHELAPVSVTAILEGGVLKVGNCQIDVPKVAVSYGEQILFPERYSSLYLIPKLGWLVMGTIVGLAIL